jgi:hypothetical protein
MLQGMAAGGAKVFTNNDFNRVCKLGIWSYFGVLICLLSQDLCKYCCQILLHASDFEYNLGTRDPVHMSFFCFCQIYNIFNPYYG